MAKNLMESLLETAHLSKSFACSRNNIISGGNISGKGRVALQFYSSGDISYPGGDGREEQPHARGQGQQPRGATPRPRSGAAAGRTNPTSKEQWLHGAQEGLGGAIPR